MEPLQNAIEKLSKQGYCCSQILAVLLLSAQGKENNDLVRSLAGLCHGIGQSGSSCGILTGGCCILTYLIWQQQENTTELQKLPDYAKIILSDYTDWFDEITAQYGSINCEDITGESANQVPDTSRCRKLLADSWIRLLGILTMHNISVTTTK